MTSNNDKNIDLYEKVDENEKYDDGISEQETEILELKSQIKEWKLYKQGLYISNRHSSFNHNCNQCCY